jgi:hypothetical protein
VKSRHLADPKQVAVIAEAGSRAANPRWIDETPSHDTVNRRDWALVDYLGERRSMGVFELRRLAWRRLVDETVGAMGVELHDPIPHDLQRHATDLGCLRPGRPS